MLPRAINLTVPAPSAAVQTKAHKAGSEFEAILLNMVLGAVEKSFSQLPGAKLHEENQAYSGMAMQALTSGLARAGGIGLGKMISAALEKTLPNQTAR